MEIIPKLNLNRNPKDIPNNSIVAAKNMVVDDTGSYFTNEWGFKVAFACPNDNEFICGVIPTNKELVIFTYCTKDKLSRIYRYKDDGSYFEVNVGWTYSGGKITGSYTYNYKGELIIAVGEYDAVDNYGLSIQIPYKSWNLDTALNLSHNQEEKVGELSYSYSITTGSLVCGVYTFFIRFAINDVDYTKWFQITPEIIIIQTKQKEAPSHTYLKGDTVVTLDTSKSNFENLIINDNKISDKGISINIEVPSDNNFLKYQIGYIIKKDEEVLGRIQNEYDINNKTIIIADNIFTKEESVDEFLKSPNQLYNVKTIVNYNNRIYLSNYEEYKNENINANDYIDSLTGVVVTSKSYKTGEVQDSYTKVNGQISYNGVTTKVDNVNFELSKVITDDNGKITISDYKGFIINNFVKVLRLYNSLGQATSPYESKDIELTEEGKKHWKSCREDYIVTLLDSIANKNRTYCPIYYSKNKTVANIKEVYIQNGNIYIITSASISVNNGANMGEHTYVIENADADNRLIWNIYIYGTFYLKDNLNTDPGHYGGYIGENLVNVFNAYPPAPKGGYKPTTNINISTIKNTYNINNGVINKTLIPFQYYNIYIHFIRPDGSYTNGYYLKKIQIKQIYNNADEGPIKYLSIKANAIPNGYIGYFFSYEEVETNSIFAHRLFKDNESMSIANTGFIYNEESMYGDIIKYLSSANIEIKGKTFNKSIVTTSNVNVKSSANNPYVFLLSKNLGNYYKNTKTLYRLTENYYDTNSHTSDAYLPGFYNREKIIVFADTSNPTTATKLKEVIFNATSSKVVDTTGAETDYGIFAKTDYAYTDKPLDAYNIKQDYSKGAASLVTSAGGAKGVFYNSVLTPDKLHDFLEIKGCYIAKPSKSFTNYNADYIDNFNKTIRRSNVISDESLVNGFRLFESEQYKIIKENKGNITNIIGIGLYMLIHTEYSLFVFDRSPKLTQTSQLQIPDVFDIDYQEVLPSNEGFGGLKDKEEAIVSKNGYIWYDSVNKIIFKYENGKASVLSSDINNFIKDLTINTVRFGEDLITNRLIICIYITVDNVNYPITISYNFNTNTFISIHDYSFTNCFRTYAKAYFFDNIKDRNRLYAFNESETGYKNLKNNNSIYYFQYINKTDENSEAKPILPTTNTVNLIKYPIIVDDNDIKYKFNDIIKNYKYIKLYHYDSDVDKTISVMHGSTSNEYANYYINDYINSTINGKHTILYGKLFNTLEDFKNDKGVDITPIELDLGLETLEDISLIYNDNNDIWNDTINFKYNSQVIYNPGRFNYYNSAETNSYNIDADKSIKISYRKYLVKLSVGTKLYFTESVNHDDTPDNIANYITCIRDKNNIIITNTSKVECKLRIIGTFGVYTPFDSYYESVAGGQVITINDSISDTISISITYKDVTKYKRITIGNYMFLPTINIINKNQLYFDTEDKHIEYLYYTLDGSNPTESSNKYVANSKSLINLTKSCTIKVVAIYTTNEVSFTRVAIYKYAEDSYPEIKDIIYTTKKLTDTTYKNYIDIVYNINPEQAKSLESIHYILNDFAAKFNNMNAAEQLLNRRFSGNSIILYSDETYSGAIDINDTGNTNVFNAYKLPTFQKGHWEFNYFRNDTSKLLDNGSFKALVFDSNKNDYELKEITDENIKSNYDKIHSDNKSLIYGRYIVARFIFNNDKRIKFEGVTFITNNY